MKTSNRFCVSHRSLLLIAVAALLATAGLSRQAIAQGWPSAIFGDVYQQTPVTQQCSNGSFEMGFSDWTGFRGSRLAGLPYENYVATGAPLLSNSCAAGPGIGNSGYGNTCHIIESSGTDPNLPSVAHPMTVAGASSLRLGGNDFTGSKSNGFAIEGAAKRFVVQASNAIYQFRYSSVMDKFHDASSSYTGDEPYFQAIAIDPATGAVIDQFVQPASGFNPWMVLSPDTPPNMSPMVYSVWTCARLDLSSHVGKEVIVYFVNSDCSQGGHTAYTYIDDVCTECDGDDITIDDVDTELKLCEPGKTTEIKGTFTVPPALNTSNVTVTIEIKQAGTTIGTLTGGTITGNTYSFPLSQADLNGLGCYDFVAVLEYDVTTPSGNVVHVRKETSAEGFKPGEDNDICVVDCPPPADHTCLETEAEVTCNPDGTVTVTVNSTSPAGFSGGTIEASTTTPGIVVLPAQQTLAPGQTQTQWVLSGPGVQAGQYVTLVIDQVDPGGGSKPGIDLCCSGEVRITIPDCPEPEVDVTIEKTATEPKFDEATGLWTFQYTLTVSNAGNPFFPLNGNIQISDPVPPGLTFVSASGTNWNCPAGQFPLNAGALSCSHNFGSGSWPTNAPLDPLVITVTVEKPGSYENCADVALDPTLGLQETTLQNNQSCTKIEISEPQPEPDVEPDLTVDKSGPSTCEAGESCGFTITITNTGDSDFEGPLLVRDEVNIPGARVTAATSGWTCSGGTCVHATVMLAPGESETLRVDVMVPASARRNFQLEQCAALEMPEPGDTPIRFVQQMLTAAGIDVGAADNQIGRQTRSGIEAFRKRAGLPGGTEIDGELLNALRGLIPADSNPDNNSDCAEARITKTIACEFGERLVGESCRDICARRNSHWDGGKCVVCGGSLVWNQNSLACVRREVRPSAPEPTTRPTPTDEPETPTVEPKEPNVEPREPACRFPQVFNPATGRCVGGEQQEEQEEEDKGDPENGGD